MIFDNLIRCQKDYEWQWAPMILKCDKFAAICTHQERITFTKFRVILEDTAYKVNKARDIYPFYVDIQKFSLAITNDSLKTRKFKKLLNKAQNKSILRVGTYSYQLDFTPILEKTLICHQFNIVDAKDSIQVSEAAQALDQLSYEGIGESFGIFVHKTMIESKESLCLVARNPHNQIIGSLFGTYVELEESIRVFHLWITVRKANHPCIGFWEKCYPTFEKSLMEIFKPDYITLNVDEDNISAFNLYQKSGFKEVEKKYNKITQTNAYHMVKSLTPKEKLPSGVEITKAIEKQAFRHLGLFSGLIYMTYFYGMKVFNGWFYK